MSSLQSCSSRSWWRERSTSRTVTWFSSTSSSGTNEQLPNLSTFLSFSLYLSHSKMDSPTARDLGMGSSLQIALATWSLSQAFVMRIVHDKDEKDWLFFGFICAIAVDKYFPCFSLNSIFSYSFYKRRHCYRNRLLRALYTNSL